MQRITSPKLILVLFVALALAAVAALLGARLPDPEGLLARPPEASILIADRAGRTLFELVDSAGNKQVPLPLAAIPPHCRAATIATEDAHFYSHPGVDPLAILRAALTNLRAGRTVSGASTLTQQLARNLYMTEAERAERTLGRKLREAWLAWRLERTYSKDELLALYLNTTYYGHYATGIEAAAQAYFGVHAGELDLAQCSLLAGLPQWPPGYNPIENPQAATQRQTTVLRLMVEYGAISKKQAQDAAQESLRFASAPFPIQAPHFVMYVQGLLESTLPAERLRAGGLRVITTLDLDWQQAAEDAIVRRLAQLRPCGAVEQPVAGVNCDPAADPTRRVENAALLALDPASGAIRTMAGSPDYFDEAISGAVNATLAQRQPGSAIKPLTYALALDPEAARKAGRPVWTAATLVPDIRSTFPTAEGEPYVPNNYDRRYHGPVSVRAALANSYNIPAVHALQHVGIEDLIDLARSLGIPWQRQGPVAEGEAQRYGLSLTLGGGEVRLIDLTAAYAALAAGGMRVEPYAIERIETLGGELVWERDAPARQPVVDERVAFLVTDILADDLARRPAFGEGSSLEIGRPAAAKTGTTTDWRDNWTVGYTPELVAGMWVGNADNTPMKDVSGVTGAGPIWHDYMTRVLGGQPPSEFTIPDGVNQVEVCADSGLLPAPSSISTSARRERIVPCPSRRLEWFIDGTEPSEIDRQHVEVWVDVQTGSPATPGAANARPQVFWQLPLEYQAWARETGFPQPPVQAANGAQQAVAGMVVAPLRLLSPDPGRRLQIDPGLPRDAQQLPVTALPSFRAEAVTLTVDGAPFAVVGGPEYTAWWPLQEGRHVFAARAVRDDGSVVQSEEVAVVVE